MRFLAVLWSLATASVYTPGTSWGGATNSSGVAAMVWVGGISDYKTKGQVVHLSQNGGPSGYLLRVKTSDHLRLTL